jgi:hypothetical protein
MHAGFVLTTVDDKPAPRFVKSNSLDRRILSAGNGFRIDLEFSASSVDLTARQLFGRNGSIAIEGERLLLCAEPLFETTYVENAYFDLQSFATANRPRAPVPHVGKWKVSLIGRDKEPTGAVIYSHSCA